MRFRKDCSQFKCKLLFNFCLEPQGFLRRKMVARTRQLKSNVCSLNKIFADWKPIETANILIANNINIELQR